MRVSAGNVAAGRMIYGKLNDDWGMVMQGAAIIGTALALLFAAPALACKGDKMLFDDDFQEQDAAWWITQAESAAGIVNAGQGRMVIRPPAEKGFTVLNMAFRLPTSLDICVTVRFVESENLAESSAGIVFWADGYADNTLFQVRGNGMFWASRWVDRAWQSITPSALAPGFKVGLGQDNQLRVRASGQTITLFVNDNQVARFRAPTPEKNAQFGVRAGSFGKGSVAVEFREFKITNVQ